MTLTRALTITPFLQVQTAYMYILQYASKKTSHKRPVQRAPVLIKRGLNGARTGRERERPFDCPFERARVLGRQCRRPAPLLRFFRTWSAKTSLDIIWKLGYQCHEVGPLLAFEHVRHRPLFDRNLLSRARSALVRLRPLNIFLHTS